MIVHIITYNVNFFREVPGGGYMAGQRQPGSPKIFRFYFFCSSINGHGFRTFSSLLVTFDI